MTREEAIKELKQFSGTTQLRLSANFWTAHNMAIEALEQETTSRESYESEYLARKQAEYELWKIKEQQPSEDCVSRKAMLDAIAEIDGNINMDIYTNEVREIIENSPSVTPTRKKRKWIFTKTIFDKYGCTAECPSCHKKWKTYDEIRWKKENKFCPNCGAEMESEE